MRKLLNDFSRHFQLRRDIFTKMDLKISMLANYFQESNNKLLQFSKSLATCRVINADNLTKQAANVQKLIKTCLEKWNTATKDSSILVCLKFKKKKKKQTDNNTSKPPREFKIPNFWPSGRPKANL